MPVEIRELVIRATVTEEGSKISSTHSAGPGEDTSSEQLVKRCVDKILEILKEKNGR